MLSIIQGSTSSVKHNDDVSHIMSSSNFIMEKKCPKKLFYMGFICTFTFAIAKWITLYN